MDSHIVPYYANDENTRARSRQLVQTNSSKIVCLLVYLFINGEATGVHEELEIKKQLRLKAVIVRSKTT